MTLVERGPYTLKAIRLLLAILSAALCACATDQVSRAEHAELLASVRALRAENARIESRLEAMEADLKGARPAPRPAAASPKTTPSSASGSTSAAPTASRDDVPALTVVKMKPKKESAPRLSTEVEVVEPPVAIVDELAPAVELPADAPDATENAFLEQQYLLGVDALKTGNPEGGIAQLQQFAREWPKHPRADNALYYAAVGLMAAREFKDAETLLEQAIRQYPAGDATLDSMMKLADCRSRLNRQADARATWEKIVATYPGTQAATLAQSRLASASQKE
ncbi:MAG: tetratricopeptide repeat protein [Myxococcales bacterium]|nr:tetratricopeptide repeat protein [Myxococcales bacterium]